jgi:tetratricopeptide (TPR) repeat protein
MGATHPVEVFMLPSAISRKFCPLLIAITLLSHRVHAQSGKYGEVAFANSGAASAQPAFLRAVALLHNFQYTEATDGFREAQRLDPSFAMAYWGEAMTYNHGVWREQDSVAARAVIARVRALPNQRMTARERAFLAAVETLYATGKAKESRDTAYALAMQRVAAREKNDVDAQLFYALSLLSLFPRTDSTYMKAAAIAERVMRDHPDHPGALHYVIHAHDDPAHARQGLAAARAYSKVAPDAAHAQHMTSHIFIALGMWDDVVAANEVSTRMGKGPACGHGAIWLHYAYLQQGRRADARRMEDACYEAAASSPMNARGFAEMRLQSVVDAEPGDSIVRRTLTITRPSVLSFTQNYGTAYDALRRSDTTRLSILFDSLAQSRQAFDGTPMARQMPEMGSAMDVGVAALRAMLLLDTGHPNEAIRLMQQTAARDDGTPFEFGPPAVPKPTHELLGEMLLSQGRAVEAQKEFESVLERTPGRSMALMDLARASRAAGDTATANRAVAQLRANWHRADQSMIQAGHSVLR